MAQRRRVAGFVSLRGSCWLILLSLCAAAACGSSQGPSAGALPAGFFGGAAGAEQPVLAGMGSIAMAGQGGSVSVLPDVCADVPEGQLGLIDDFEDADQDAVPEIYREAYWFTINDGSTGSIVPNDKFLGGVSGGAHGSRQAAHITASGFSNWGAAFAANVRHLENNISCPYNARHFSGYRFYARGSGAVFVTLQVPGIVDEQYGGTCRPSEGDVCYDAHGTWIYLTPDWQTYSFKWSDFRQRGFGKKAAFDPGAILSIQFSFEKAQLPVDAWFDDVSWDDGSPFPGATGGGAGTGGGGQAGNSGASGGTGGMGGTGGIGGMGGIGFVAGSAGQVDPALDGGAGGASGAGSDAP